MQKLKVAFIVDDFNSSLISGLSFEHSIINEFNTLNPDGIEFYLLTKSAVNHNPYTFINVISIWESRFSKKLKAIRRKALKICRLLGVIKIIPGLNPLVYIDEITFPYDNVIEKYEIDLGIMIFSNHILKIPYFSVCLDINEQIHSELPEFGFNRAEWLRYDNFRRDYFRKSTKIFVGTMNLMNSICRSYGLHDDKIRINPFFVPLNEKIDELNRFKNTIKIKYDDLPIDYIFFPARYIPQKNHYYLLEALNHLKQDKGIVQNVVMCGYDKGNLIYLKDIVNKLNILDQVVFLDVVDYSDLISLYKNAKALIFPVLNGPDNLPPLEAMSLDCPVLISELDGHKEQLGDAAFYFDPINPYSIAEAILRLDNEIEKRKIIELGKILVNQRTIINYCSIMLNEIFGFWQLRKTWPNRFNLRGNR